MVHRLRLTQSGGIAGLSMVADVDVDDLPAHAAAQVRDALPAVAFDPPGGRAGAPPPGGPDRYQYDLEEVTDHGRRSVTAHEPDLTPAFKTVVDVLLPLARPE